MPNKEPNITPKTSKELQKSRYPKNVRFSIRLSSQSVTSVSINTQILLLWLLFQPKISLDSLDSLKLHHCKAICTDFFISQMKNWHYNTGKGLSEFLTEAMIRNILEESPNLEKTFNKIQDIFKEG